jgi:hypothetical protein
LLKKITTMKKNRLLLILAIVLVIAGSLFVVNHSYTTLSLSESGFAIADTATVTKIFMADMNNRTVKLEKLEPGVWMLNEHYPANNYNVAMLLRTVKELTVRYPVPLVARDNVISRLATIARKVEIYQMEYAVNLFNYIKLFPREKLTRTYYVGDATADNRGTYMQMEGAEQPYVVFLPMLRGYIYPRFSTDEDDWRDHSVFQTPINELASVRIEFLEEPEESFIVENDGSGNFTLTTLHDGLQKDYDTLRMLQFVSAFKDLRYEAVLNNKLEQHYIDSITSGNEAHRITLEDIEGEQYFMKTYRKRGFADLYEHDGAALEPFDLDRLYAYVNDNRDFVLIQYFVFDKVLRTASYLQKLE